jgi:predicted nucleic acid-binding protein
LWVRDSPEGRGFRWLSVSLDLADLLHAATARVHDATFVTCDASDFDKTPIHQLMDIDIIEPTDSNQ